MPEPDLHDIILALIDIGGGIVPVPDLITPTVANHVLAQVAQADGVDLGPDVGYLAGSFTQPLLEAFLHADNVNFARLATAFPGYGAAVAMYKYTETGVDRLREIARRHG